MIYAKFLKTNPLILITLSEILVGVFRALASRATEKLNAKYDRKHKSKSDSQKCKSGDDLHFRGWKVSKTDFEKEDGVVGMRSLFPMQSNVDRSLELRSSVCPCSIDLSTFQSPVSIIRTPDGNMEWIINTSLSFESPALQMLDEPLSPRSNSSIAPCKEEEESAGGTEKFVCHYCDAEFRIRGYLTRHIKKHAVEKAYHCPYFNNNLPPETRCHTTGGFSRRDTYKTHLRSRHFIYPEGIRIQDRNGSCGHCAHCGKWFENTSKWIEKHIESGTCSSLPEGTILPAKSARKAGKLKMIKTSTGHSRFITTQQSVVESKVLLNKEAIEAMQILVKEANISGEPALTKLSDNRILLNSTNFKGKLKAKKAIKRQRKKALGIVVDSIDCIHQRLTEESVLNLDSGSYAGRKMLEDQVYLPSTAPSLPTHYIFATPNEVLMDELSFSINLSPKEDSSLEPVISLSSLSSTDVNVGSENTITKMLCSLNSTDLPNTNDTYYLPLDLEQTSVIMPVDELSPILKNHSES